MKLLAIDTAADRCAACVFDVNENRVLSRCVEPMRTGHAERLMAVIDMALRDAQTDFPDLGAIVVATGPGSFTGIRVGLATARGFGVGLRVPVIGIDVLRAVAEEARGEYPGRPVTVALDGGRGEIHAASYGADGAVIEEPAALTLEQVMARALTLSPVLAGTAAPKVCAELPDSTLGTLTPTADIETFARLGAQSLASDPNPERPRPLYLRAPDAKPQSFTLSRRES
ncbi:MAG: tRNA (adenosine(37)-N6)-threonylcarbamoyltransferase complex dimerization subunit type 1 TsaB [Methylobacterium mesophilicum]|nr:tRNA (adenosine(37)-N6)-threonylcarbamoyltransferase complex dimerization subunit type 1 TsaB [Methylobacterium mesophilicum]